MTIDNEKPYRVVVIDDDLSALNLLQMILKYVGADIETHTTPRPQEGFDLVMTLCPDLVIVDLHLPMMNGFEVIQKIKSTPTIQHLPVIAITAGGEQTRRRAIEAGADEYVQKPLVIVEFQKLVMRYRQLAPNNCRH